MNDDNNIYGDDYALNGDDLHREITPEEAERLLESMGHNRNVRESMVNNYVDDIRKGLWDPYSVIRLDESDDTLIDGQHRLVACVRTRTPIRAIVIRQPRDSMRNVDIGGKRTLGDQIKFLNPETHSVTKIAALVKALAAWDPEEGELTSANRFSQNTLLLIHAGDNVLKAGPDDFVRAISVVEPARAALARKGFPASGAMMALAYLLIQHQAKDPLWADAFFEEWARGDYTPNDALGVLDRALSPFTTTKKNLPSIAQYTGRRRFLLMVLKGWNAWSTGDVPHRFLFYPAGPADRRTRMPVIEPGEMD